MIISESSHCALIILSELTFHHDSKWVSIVEIAEKNHIPENILQPIAERLCQLGIVHYHQENRWMTLQIPLTDISVYNIVVHFDGDLFSGRFMDEKTGRILPKSKYSHMINLERNHMMLYVKRRFRKLNVNHWCELANRVTHF